MKKNMFSGLFDKMVANFIPQEDEDARLSLQGTVVVKTNTPNGKEWVDKDGTVYSEDFISDFPVFTVAKAVKDVAVGDIVKLTKSTFATVTEIKDGKVETLSFGGQHRQAKAFKDMFIGQATVRVVANFLANSGTPANMNTLMMLSALSKESDDRNDFMKTMMLVSMFSGAGQNPLGSFNNPMALAYLMKGDNGSVQDIMMMQALQSGAFANIFGNIPVAAPQNEAANEVVNAQ